MEARMLVKNVLMDIDNTLTYERNNYVRKGIPGGGNYSHILLAEMLAKKQSVAYAEALAKVDKAEAPCRRKDAFFAVRTTPEWGISEDTLWNRCVRWQEKRLFFYRDAADMIRALKKKGFNLMTASNNGSLGCLLKLAREGFATRRGTTYFSFLFGDDLTGCQKDKPEYFKKLLKMAKIDPEESVMIGDSVEQDYESAKAGGFRNIILVDRKRKKGVTTGEPLVVNSLREVVKILSLK